MMPILLIMILGWFVFSASDRLNEYRADHTDINTAALAMLANIAMWLMYLGCWMLLLMKAMGYE